MIYLKDKVNNITKEAHRCFDSKDFNPSIKRNLYCSPQGESDGRYHKGFYYGIEAPLSEFVLIEDETKTLTTVIRELIERFVDYSDKSLGEGEGRYTISSNEKEEIWREFFTVNDVTVIHVSQSKKWKFNMDKRNWELK